MRTGLVLRLAVDVAIEALAALAPETAGGEQLAGQRVRAVARFLVVLLVDRFHYRVRHVEAGEIEQFKRPHAEAGALAQHTVNLGAFGDAFAEDAQGLGAIGAAGMVDDEAGAVLGPYTAVAQARGEGEQGVADFRSAGQAVDHLDHAHQRHRVEEVKAGDPLRPLAGGGDGGDRQRRGIAGEDGLRRDYGFQPAQQFLLGLQALDDGLHHQFAVAQLFQAFRHPQPVLRGLGVGGAQLAFAA